jgi:hypothetical protein
MTDLMAPRLTAVALVEAWLDDRVTAYDVLLPDEDDADPLRDLGAIIGGLVVLGRQPRGTSRPHPRRH